MVVAVPLNVAPSSLSAPQRYLSRTPSQESTVAVRRVAAATDPSILFSFIDSFLSVFVLFSDDDDMLHPSIKLTQSIANLTYVTVLLQR